ncbi:MAG: hypothetical protein WBE82_15280 [Xanthobacteraceae bacterium]|jgi:hypothetical protein
MNTASGRTGSLNSRIDVRLRKIRSRKTSALQSKPPKVVPAMATATIGAPDKPEHPPGVPEDRPRPPLTEIATRFST